MASMAGVRNLSKSFTRMPWTASPARMLSQHGPSLVHLLAAGVMGTTRKTTSRKALVTLLTVHSLVSQQPRPEQKCTNPGRQSSPLQMVAKSTRARRKRRAALQDWAAPSKSLPLDSETAEVVLVPLVARSNRL